MTDSIRQRTISANDPTVRAPRAPKANPPLDRSVDYIAAPPTPSVTYFTEGTRALASAEAATLTQGPPAIPTGQNVNVSA